MAVPARIPVSASARVSNVRTSIAALFALGVLVAMPLALASDLGDVGTLDQAAVSNLPRFVEANRQVVAFKTGLDKQFTARMKAAHSQADQQRIITEFRGRLQDRQRALLGPLFGRAQTAIASVSSSKNLSVIVDKSIVIFGGQDITKAVIDLMQSPGPIAAPVSTPPPSEIGFVDNDQIDAIPKLKTANDDFLRFNEQQKRIAAQKMSKAKTDAERQQVLRDYQKTVSDRQDQQLKPLADQTKSAIADIGKKKNLVLVIDKGHLIYGGTDITPDVQNAFK
ncbi:MAG: hypothetical protein DLM50_00410 [Candidatus Meridianibacter frigidus]|nr:MAG: hypothetical protein DLM50_00410 [Candidatus Eremiobacteraeota bacterium]